MTAIFRKVSFVILPVLLLFLATGCQTQAAPSGERGYTPPTMDCRTDADCETPMVCYEVEGVCIEPE